MWANINFPFLYIYIYIFIVQIVRYVFQNALLNSSSSSAHNAVKLYELYYKCTSTGESTNYVDNSQYFKQI